MPGACQCVTLRRCMSHRVHDFSAWQTKKISYRWQTARRICANVMAYVADLLEQPFSLYHAEFGPFALHCVGINTGDGRRDWKQDTRLSSTCFITSNLVVLRQKGIPVNRKEPQNLWSAGTPSAAVEMWLCLRKVSKMLVVLNEFNVGTQSA